MNLFAKKQAKNTPKRRLVEVAPDISPLSNSFKRNKTISNTSFKRSVANDIISDQKSPRAHVHHLVIRRRKVFSILMTSLFSAILIWLLISNFTAIVSINSVNMSISKPLDNSIYEKKLQEYLDNKPMSRFRFVMDVNDLNTYLNKSLPEVEEITQQNTLGIGVTTFSIKLRKPVAGWRIDDKQYYVDAKGVPFERNYFIEPSVNIVDNSGVSPLKVSGAAIASKRFLGFVGRVVALSESYGYTVTQATLPVNTTRELDINIKEKPYSIKLSIDRSTGEQLEDMDRAIKYLDSHAKSLGYIDVRVSGRAFYK